jgi:ribosomal protein S12 methylthiotransferase accessory factor
MQLNPSPKIYQNYKCDHPKNTINKIQKGFKKIGLNITYKDTKINDEKFSVYVSQAFIDILGIVQYGKGITKDLAKASAYAEVVERFSTGAVDIRIPFSKKPGKYKNLLKDINDRKFLKGYQKIKDNNLFNENELNKYVHKKFTKKQLESFKELGVMDNQVDAYSIIKKTYKKIPIDFIEMYSNTNGLAAGNTIEEAISQASFEIFERYASKTNVSKMKVCPTIDPETIEDKQINKCIDLLKSLNIEVFIKDFTLNNSIPVIGTLFIDNNLKNTKNKLIKRNYKRINVGSHIDLNEAIKRCFSENLQLIGMEKEKHDVLYNAWTKILGKKYVGIDDDFRYFIRGYDYYGDASFLEKGKKIDFNSLDSYKKNDSLKDVERISDICKKNKWDFLVIDYTHKILQFPTVRVIIPPISVSSYLDPFMNKLLKINNFQDRFNYFYGIKDFFSYLKDDDWINDKRKIRLLIENIEKYLSEKLDHYYFYINRQSNFSQLINTFHILPFLYLSINDYKEAKKYFEALIYLDFQPPVKSAFYKSLYQTKYNPKKYKNYILQINRCIEKKSDYKYKLKANPFNPETGTKKIEKIYCQLLTNINKSFI